MRDADGSERPRPRRRLELAVPLLGYLAVTLAGVTTSSLGIGAMREQPDHPLGLMLGVARSIRTDEWLTEAPIELSALVQGAPATSPLTHASDLIYQISSGGFFETLLFFEGNLLRLGPWLPDSMAFAAFRAFPVLLVLMAVPPLLRRFGATRPLSWLGVALTLLSPAAVWWSFIPIRPLAFATAGSYLLILARDRFVRGSWLVGTLWSCAAGLAIGRLGTFYVPWSLTIGVPIVAATSAYLLANRRALRCGVRALLTAATVSIVLLGGALFENRGALAAELGTVYPGQRRAGGSALSTYQLFGAPGLADMQTVIEPVFSNKSEISSAFLIAGLWALTLWRFHRPGVSAPQRWAARVLGGSTALWASWAMINWGPLGERVPGMNLVTPPRAAQTVGFVAAFLACVVVGHMTERPRARAWLLAGTLTALVTAYGVHDLRRPLPDVSLTAVCLSALVTGVLVAAVTKRPDHWAPTAFATAALVLLSGLVNPILFGLGDLRTSSAASQVSELGDRLRGSRQLAAADTPTTTALLVANGVPSLTGYQVTGPNRPAWHKIDPSGRYEGKWNRGASYIRMTFDRKAGLPPIVSNPANDSISVSIDPCDLRSSFPVSVVISIHTLRQPCLRQVSTFRWSGVVNRVYAVDRPDLGSARSAVPGPTAAPDLPSVGRARPLG